MSDESSVPTLIQCLACGGRWKITENLPDGREQTHTCKWCTEGFMDRNQEKGWRAFVHRRKSSGKIKAVKDPK